MWQRILAFLAMGTVLPMVAARAFWGAGYTSAYAALFGIVFMIVYVVFLPLYRRVVEPARRRWWKELLGLIWFYIAVIGMVAFIIVLF